MKKTFYIPIIIFIISFVFSFFYHQPNITSHDNEKLKTASTNIEKTFERPIVYDIPETLPEDPIHAAAVTEYLSLMENKDIPNKKEWFLEYKNLISKYSKDIDPPETLADYYEDDELYLIYYVVETLTEEKAFDNYILTATDMFIELENVSATLEYLYDNGFVSEIDTTIVPSDDVKLACDYAFEIGL